MESFPKLFAALGVSMANYTLLVGNIYDDEMLDACNLANGVHPAIRLDDLGVSASGLDVAEELVVQGSF